MKFLIQIPQLIFGGAEKVLVSFANELVSRGHDVEILEIYEKDLLRPQFDPRVRFGAICSIEYNRRYYASLNQIRSAKWRDKPILCAKKIFSRIVGYRRFAEYLAARRYSDISYDAAINYLETEPPDFLLKHINAKKYIQWYHTDVANLDHPEDTDRMIPTFTKMDAIVCVAKSARDSFIVRYPQLESKTHVIYNFFDADTIRQMADEPFSYDDDRFVMLSVGRMTPQKRYLRFLDVLARLRDDGFSFVWHVLGTGADYDAICEKIGRLGLEDCVRPDGVTDNPYKYMKNCDLFVLPSGWEGFPTVTVEAKIVGCAVLATDVSGIMEQLVHGENGWIVDNSEDGIYSGIRAVLEGAELKNNSLSDEIFNSDKKIQYFFDLVRSRK